MRWKLLIPISIVAAIVAFGLCEALIQLVFASSRPVSPHNSALLASVLIPLIIATLAGIFIYRHTARRRKTQAAIASLLVLVFATGMFLAGAWIFPSTLGVPTPCNTPHCA